MVSALVVLACPASRSTAAQIVQSTESMAASPAAVQSPLPGISLDWNDCPGGATSTSDLSYACASNSDNLSLICSAVTSVALANTIGVELVVDIQHSAPSLPDWWRFDASGTGGCRGGALSFAFDYPAGPSCTDAWAFNGFGGLQRFSIGSPDHPFTNQARIVAVAAVTSDNAVTLAPSVTYGLIRMIISTVNTTGAGACAGCITKACLVFNSALIRRISGAGGDVFLSTAAFAGSNWATWQGTGADCSQVPTRRKTWGEIKSLYR